MGVNVAGSGTAAETGENVTLSIAKSQNTVAAEEMLTPVMPVSVRLKSWATFAFKARLCDPPRLSAAV
jgi:hypothetical protein